MMSVLTFNLMPFNLGAGQDEQLCSVCVCLDFR